MRTRDQPAAGWTVVLRRQPGIVRDRPEGGYTGVFGLICCDCGDHPGLDYRDVSRKLQRIRGPYPLATGIAAYEKYLKLSHERIPMLESVRILGGVVTCYDWRVWYQRS